MSPVGPQMPPLTPEQADTIFLRRCPECGQPCSSRTQWSATTLRTTWHCPAHGEVDPAQPGPAREETR